MQNTPPKTSNSKIGIAIIAVFSAIVMCVSYISALSKFVDVTGEETSVIENADESIYSYVVDDSSEEENEADEYVYYGKLNLENFPRDNEDVANGALAILDGESQIFPSVEQERMVNIAKKKTSNVYGLSTTSLVIYDEAMTNFDNFIVSFYNQVPKNGLIINKGYTSIDQVSPMETTIDLVTGYSVQFSIFNSGYRFSSDEFAYLKEQAFRYGIIQRYPADKESYTGHTVDNTIYRYVGLAHSLYMNHYRYTLEEYLDVIRTETIIEYESELEPNTIYVVYYIPADDNAETTYVPLPINGDCTYDVSGDGKDGFIVTVKMPKG